MSVEERVRYDRQIRLWGLTAQQRLMQTSLTFYGIAGAASEVAKNMALAGVKCVRVVDANPITSADLSNSFLLQPLETAEAELRERVACARLRGLNPFVSVLCGAADDADAPSAGAAETTTPVQGVALVQAASLAEACAMLQCAKAAELAVVSFALGRTVTLSVFVGSADALREALSSRETLTSKPAAFQQVALALQLRQAGATASSSFAQRLQCAAGLVEQLGLFALAPEHIAAAVEASADAHAVPADAVSTTVAGASIAQFVTQLIRDDAVHQGRLPYTWLLCDTSCMDVLVGDL